MKIQERKYNVIQKLMSLDAEILLDKIEKILDEEMIVAYAVEGQPLTLEAYNKRLEKGEEQIKNGNFITQEDLERESENW